MICHCSGCYIAVMHPLGAENKNVIIPQCRADCDWTTCMIVQFSWTRDCSVRRSVQNFVPFRDCDAPT